MVADDAVTAEDLHAGVGGSKRRLRRKASCARRLGPCAVVRGAIDLGFSRAFSVIIDGQLTTAAAGWVLLNYGSGPIKGIAVMLLVGCFTMIIVNMWVTRILFDWVVARKKGSPMQTLSI